MLSYGGIGGGMGAIMVMVIVLVLVVAVLGRQLVRRRSTQVHWQRLPGLSPLCLLTLSSRHSS
jgi:hypothetical protein